MVQLIKLSGGNAFWYIFGGRHFLASFQGATLLIKLSGGDAFLQVFKGGTLPSNFSGGGTFNHMLKGQHFLSSFYGAMLFIKFLGVTLSTIFLEGLF